MNYKGMDRDMKCRGFQYEVGKEYETDRAEACECGFHACEYPLDVFNYYAPANSRYFEVEQSGQLSRSDGDSKVASTKIKIGAELSIAGLVKAAIEYTREKSTEEIGGHATGYQGAASATGKASVALAAGIEGKAMGALGCADLRCGARRMGRRDISHSEHQSDYCRRREDQARRLLHAEKR